MSDRLVLVDEPAPHVRRITMNRPEKRNALNHALRGDLIDALARGRPGRRRPRDDRARRRPSFSAGYDLGGGNEGQEMPHFTAGRATATGPATSPRGG